MDNPKKSVNLSRQPKKLAEYNTFVVWRSIPAFIKKKTVSEIRGLGFDDAYIELCKVKTLTAFAKKFSVNKSTLTDWQKLDKFRSDLKRLTDKSIFLIYGSAVAHAFALETIAKPSADKVALFYKLFNNVEDPEDNMNEEGMEVDSESIYGYILAKVMGERGAAEYIQSMKERTIEISSGEVGAYPSQEHYDFEHIKSVNEDETTVEEIEEKKQEGKPLNNIREKLLKKVEERKKKEKLDELKRKIEKRKK